MYPRGNHLLRRPGPRTASGLKTLLVTGIPAALPNSALVELFEEFGPVVSYGKFEGSLTTGWVQYSSARSAEKAVFASEAGDLEEYGIFLEFMPRSLGAKTYQGMRMPNDASWGNDDDDYDDGGIEDIDMSRLTLTSSNGTRTVTVNGRQHRASDYTYQYLSTQEENLLQMGIHNRIHDIQTKSCVGCHRPTSYSCGRCGQAWYCNERCQADDWPKHKEACNNKMPRLNFAGKSELDVDPYPAQWSGLPTSETSESRGARIEREPRNDSYGMREQGRHGAPSNRGRNFGARREDGSSRDGAPRRDASANDRGPHQGGAYGTYRARRDSREDGSSRDVAPRKDVVNTLDKGSHQGGAGGMNRDRRDNNQNGTKRDDARRDNGSRGRDHVDSTESKYSLPSTSASPALTPRLPAAQSKAPAASLSTAHIPQPSGVAACIQKQAPVAASAAPVVAAPVVAATVAAAPVAVPVAVAQQTLEAATATSAQPPSPAVACSATQSPQPSVAEIKNKDLVVITEFNNELLYVRPADQQNTSLLSNIVLNIKKHCADAPPLGREPRKKELVACQFMEDGLYYRAQVVSKPKKDEATYIVRFVDFGNTQTANSSMMKALSSELEQAPFLAVKTFLRNVGDFNDSCRLYLQSLVNSEKPLTVELPDGSVDKGAVLFSNEGNVNETLTTLMKSNATTATGPSRPAAAPVVPTPAPAAAPVVPTPAPADPVVPTPAPAAAPVVPTPVPAAAPVVPTPAPAAAPVVPTPAPAPAPATSVPAAVIELPAPSVQPTTAAASTPSVVLAPKKFIMGDLPPMQLPQGRPFSIYIHCILDEMEVISCCDLDDPNTAAVFSIGEELAAYANSVSGPYRPFQGELCIVKWSEDGAWYRAVSMDENGDKVSVMFIDYGNMYIAPLADIRPMGEQFVKLPALAVLAQFDGIPIQTPIKERLKTILASPAHFPGATVTSVVDDVYTVKVPEIENKLRLDQVL